eukprot:SM000271S10024  [mRNA]  locus=s271:120765:121288:+ [translate_table: standard]
MISAGALIVYDITRPATLASAPRWLAELRATAGSTVRIALVGNKTDLARTRRAVPVADAEAFARAEGLFFTETSAADASNVDRAFAGVLAEACAALGRRPVAAVAAAGNGDGDAASAAPSRGVAIQLPGRSALGNDGPLEAAVAAPSRVAARHTLSGCCGA